MSHAAAAARSRLDRTYSVVVVLKGVDGAVELLLGVLLLVAPTAVQRLLAVLGAEVGDGDGDSTWRTVVGNYLGQAASSLGDTSTGAVLFLLVHGVVKLVTVYCLIRRLVRLYPWAIAVLSVLLVVQLHAAITEPGVGAWILAVLDVVVIVLVALEYRRLRRERGQEQSPGRREKSA